MSVITIPRGARFRCLAVWVLGLTLGVAGSPTSAQETGRAESASNEVTPVANGDPLRDAEITEWIADLDDSDFEIREKATGRLTNAGVRAIPAVAQAAESENLEVATRALQVLKTLYESKDPDAQAEAAIAIKRLCDSPRKSIARRAAAILDAPHQKMKGATPAGGALPGLRFNARGLVPGGVARQVSVQNVNGKVQISVVEGSRRIQIGHSNNRDIVVKVTEPRPEGDEKNTREFKAIDLEEMRQKHPEGARLFEEYAGDNQFQGLGGQLFPGGFPPGFPGLPEIRNQGGNRGQAVQRRKGARNPSLPQPDLAVESLEKTQKRLGGLVERLRELSARQNIGAQEIEKLAEELKTIEDEVSESADEVRELGRP